MRKRTIATGAVACLCALAAATGGARAASWKDVESFSDIRKDIDLARLAKGEILGERIQVPSTPLGISVQTCYLVGAPPQQVLAKMQDDQSSEQVKGSKDFDKEGTFRINAPAQPTDFAPLSLDPGLRQVKSVLDHAVEADTKKGRLNLSPDEAKTLAGAMRELQTAHGNGWMKAGRDKAEEAFRALLHRRASAFQQGGLSAMAAYDTGSGNISVKDELLMMTRSRPKAYERFGALFSAALSGQAPAGATTPPRYYWESAKVQGEETFNLGAFFAHPTEGGFRALEVQYYVSSKYYTSLILYELWPADVDGKSQTLVWRADFVSTSSIPFLKGIERLAAENIMLLEVKKSIGAFIRETSR